ncbi:hypothetical protein EII21_01145 [Conchiformibius steedae]|uniref:Solute-binding protein family 3/N-terminal domain-containing protein n=2 Tax=Conchiformibius steedae TaxID=153493 RepID=A0A3P2A881_9NEIS|nr:hypothetical protein EII21_01145 [Conchiformibius steedae]
MQQGICNRLSIMMKKLLFTLSAMYGLAACSPELATPTAASHTTTASAASVPALPVYTVATDATYPPFEFYDDKGNIIGLDVDLLNAIAEDQGFQVRYYHYGWKGIFGQLKDSADIIASAVAITEESKKAADLSDEYYRSPYMAVSLMPDALKKWKQHKISASHNEDTIADLQAEYKIAGHNILPADTIYLSLTNLLKKQADITVADATVLQYYINSATFTGYEFHTQPLPSANPETDKLVFAVAKGNEELLEKINTGLKHIRENGKLDEILQRWRQHLPPTEQAMLKTPV